MTLEVMKFTHTGRLGLCPIILSDIESGNPIVMSRYQWTEWFLDTNEFFYSAINTLCSLLNPEFEPYVNIKITGECDIEFTYEKDE